MIIFNPRIERCLNFKPFDGDKVQFAVIISVATIKNRPTRYYWNSDDRDSFSNKNGGSHHSCFIPQQALTISIIN